MPAPLDYLRILSEAGAPAMSDPDARLARARAARGRRRWLRLPGWLTETRRTPGDGLTVPTLRDYPWRSSDGA